MALQIRTWLALHVGCDPDDLRFAGSDARGPNAAEVYFTVHERPGYEVRITQTAGVGRQRAWRLVAEWPGGSATATVDEKPGW